MANMAPMMAPIELMPMVGGLSTEEMMQREKNLNELDSFLKTYTFLHWGLACCVGCFWPCGCGWSPSMAIALFMSGAAAGGHDKDQNRKTNYEHLHLSKQFNFAFVFLVMLWVLQLSFWLAAGARQTENVDCDKDENKDKDECKNKPERETQADNEVAFSGVGIYYAMTGYWSKLSQQWFGAETGHYGAGLIFVILFALAFGGVVFALNKKLDGLMKKCKMAGPIDQTALLLGKV